MDGGSIVPKGAEDWFGKDNKRYCTTPEFSIVNKPALEWFTESPPPEDVADDEADESTLAVLAGYKVPLPSTDSDKVHWILNPYGTAGLEPLVAVPVGLDALRSEDPDDYDAQPQKPAPLDERVGSDVFWAKGVARGRWTSEHDLTFNTWCSDGAALVRRIFQMKSEFDGCSMKDYNLVRGKCDAYRVLEGSVAAFGFTLRDSVKLANLDFALGFLLSNLKDSDNDQTFASLAGGPGGFVEYLVWRAVRSAEKDDEANMTTGFGITHRPGPAEDGWRVTDDWQVANLISRCPDHVTFMDHYGADDTGDITKPKNLRAFIKAVWREAAPIVDGLPAPSWATDVAAAEGIMLVLGDGALDWRGQFNNQEFLVHALLLAQCLGALMLLRRGGCAVIKFYDMYSDNCASLAYLMHRCFAAMTIVKTLTSRPASSERYVIFYGYLARPVTLIHHLLDLLEECRNCTIAAASLLTEKLRLTEPNEIADIDAQRRELQTVISFVSPSVIRTPPSTQVLVNGSRIGVSEKEQREEAGQNSKRAASEGDFVEAAELYGPGIDLSPIIGKLVNRSFFDYIRWKNRSIAVDIHNSLAYMLRIWNRRHEDPPKPVPDIVTRALISQCAEEWDLHFDAEKMESGLRGDFQRFRGGGRAGRFSGDRENNNWGRGRGGRGRGGPGRRGGIGGGGGGGGLAGAEPLGQSELFHVQLSRPQLSAPSGRGPGPRVVPHQPGTGRRGRGRTAQRGRAGTGGGGDRGGSRGRGHKPSTAAGRGTEGRGTQSTPSVAAPVAPPQFQAKNLAGIFNK